MYTIDDYPTWALAAWRNVQREEDKLDVRLCAFESPEIAEKIENRSWPLPRPEIAGDTTISLPTTEWIDEELKELIAEDPTRKQNTFHLSVVLVAELLQYQAHDLFLDAYEHWPQEMPPRYMILIWGEDDVITDDNFIALAELTLDPPLYDA